MSHRRLLRRHGTTVALVVAAIVLLTAVWLDRPGGASPEAGARALLLGTLEPAAVDRIAIRRGPERLELRAVPASADGATRWAVGGGAQGELADERAVAELLAKLGLARAERAVDSAGLDDATLGLARPSWQVEIAQPTRQWLLAIGADAPSPPGARYARVRETGDRAAGTERTCVVSRELAQSLDELVGRLRVRGLLAGGGAVVERLVVREPGGAERWTLSHVPAWGRGAEGYRISTPRIAQGVRADWRPVEAVLATLRTIEIERVAPEAPPAPPLDGGALERFSIEVQERDHEQTVLQIVGPCGDGDRLRVVRTRPSPMAGCIASKRLVALDVAAERLVDRHVVGASASLVSELQIARGKLVLEVARRGRGWIMRAPREGEADSGAVDAWLSDLLGLAGDVVAYGGDSIDRARLGLEPPAATGRFVSVGVGGEAQGTAERIEPIEVGAARDGTLHLRRLEDGAVLRLDAAAARTLAPDGAALRDPTLLSLPAHRVMALDITARGDRQRVEWSETESSWRLLEPAEPSLRADPALVGDLVDRLSKLRALRWVDPAEGRPDGLERPWCTVALRLGPPRTDGAALEPDAQGDEVPAGPVRLSFGRESAGGYVARLEGEPMPFVASRQTVLLACSWLLDRGALLVDLGSVNKVTLRPSDGSEALVVTPRGGEWHAARGAEPVAGAGAVVRDTLEGLFAEAVVRVGPAAPEEQLDRPRLTLTIELAARPGEPARSPLEIRVGAGDSWRGTSVFYLRRADAPATFVVAQGKLRALLDQL